MLNYDFHFLSSPLLLPLTIFVLLIYDFHFLSSRHFLPITIYVTLQFPFSHFTILSSLFPSRFTLLYNFHFFTSRFSFSLFTSYASLHDLCFVNLRFSFSHSKISIFSLHGFWEPGCELWNLVVILAPLTYNTVYAGLILKFYTKAFDTGIACQG